MAWTAFWAWSVLKLSGESLMTDTRPPRDDDAASEVEQQAKPTSTHLAGDFWDFLRHYKKWWLTPVIGLLLLAGLIALLGGTAAGPFIYALF
jgi:hypothetical protein